MTSRENQDKSMLKQAQFRSFISHHRGLIEKNVEFILHEVVVNSKISETSVLKQNHSKLIGDTLLHVAYKKLNFCAFNTLIRKHGIDFNAKDANGNTVLHNIFHHLCAAYSVTKWDIKREESHSINKRAPFFASILSAHVEQRNTNNPSDSHGLTHFHIACATNSVKAVEFFLNNHVPVNQAVTKAISGEYFEGFTGLHFAAQFGYIQVIEILLKHGAITSIEDSKGRTPLHVSLERNIAMIDSATKACTSKEILSNEQVINLLKTHTIHPKLPQLCILSAMQDPDEEVISQSVNVNEFISTDSKIWPGYTALHFAAQVNVDTVKLLMELAADVEAKDVNGMTPFDLCIERYGAEDVFDIVCQNPRWEGIVMSDGTTRLVYLLSALKDARGISIFLLTSTENVKFFVPLDSLLWPGFSLLHIAVLLCELEKCTLDYKVKDEQVYFEPDLTVVAEILRQGADVTVKDGRGWTPVHLAYRSAKAQTLNLLLKYHHKTKNFVDNESLSHLHVACAVGNASLVEKFLWNDVDVNVAYKGDTKVSVVCPGWTPLHVAVRRQDHDITKLLIKFGADVNAVDQCGFTPIHRLGFHAEGFSRILFGVEITKDFVVEGLGLSYLHVACWNGNVDAVERLLDLGVDVNKVITSKTDDMETSTNVYGEGWSPLHCALRNLCLHPVTRLRFLRLLFERGADLLLNDSNGISPLTLLLIRKNREYMDFVVATLKQSEDLRRRVETETGVTMLHIACRKLDQDLIKELLDGGANVNAKVPEDSALWPGYTPMHVMVVGYVDFEGSEGEDEAFHECLKLLLARGADVCVEDGKGRTPVHIAYRRVYAESDESSLTQLSLMLKSHKDFEINPTTIEGVSHFHIACHILDVEVVEDFLNLGEVDVNSTIDAFSNCLVAACTPLLLTTRPANWRGNSDAKSFDKLKIVDALIERGARVNIEDIDGNTPAHHAALDSSPRENLLQRLAKGGALMHARNVHGQTPLELLLRKDEPTHEEIRYFIACGCLFNDFNLITHGGCLAVADSALSREDLLCLLSGTFINYPNSMAKDAVNRTAMHNLVSVYGSKTEESRYAELFDMLVKLGCDVDDQDKLGRTPLHVAAYFRNEPAVAGLLSVGANVNITDRNGDTPFARAFTLCSPRCSVPVAHHDQFAHAELFRTFVTQMHKLQLCGLDMHKCNEYYLSETFKKFNSDYLIGRHENFLPELTRMREMRVEPYALTVGDFVSDTKAVIDYPTMPQAKRYAVDRFFRTNKSRFREEFKEAAGVIQLQYGQAVLRQKIINEAKNSLSTLMKFRLPDCCSHIVLQLLKNSELQNLILSTSQEEDTKMDVDG